MLNRPHLLGVLISVSAFGFACGSQDTGSTVAGAAGGAPQGTGGTTGLMLAGGAGGVGNGTGGAGGIGITGMHDGGTVPVTGDQLTMILSSACVSNHQQGTAVPSVLELVVDTSGSMGEAPMGSPRGTPTKWVSTQGALESAITGLSDTTAVGVLLYPNMNPQPSDTARAVSACVAVNKIVPIDVLGATGSGQRMTLQNTFQNAMPQGSTPTDDAYRYALVAGMDAYASTAQKFMLLITDGAPTYSQNCVGNGNANSVVDPQPIIDDIANALKNGVRTFVIGSPGSEVGPNGMDERVWLSQAARAGGTATAGCVDTGPNFCHFDMTTATDFGAALAMGLGQISSQLDTCTYTIPPAPSGMAIDTSQINVVLSLSTGSEIINPDNVGDCTEGWQINAMGEIILCADTCARAKADPSAKVDLVFGCASGDLNPPK
ncbi:MAG TPA: vWA domain-containing protein [Polyangiaceae bacterium]|jgi:hypothetical protein